MLGVCNDDTQLRKEGIFYLINGCVFSPECGTCFTWSALLCLGIYFCVFDLIQPILCGTEHIWQCDVLAES